MVSTREGEISHGRNGPIRLTFFSFFLNIKIQVTHFSPNFSFQELISYFSSLIQLQNAGWFER